jgi:hypothetical protein
MSPAVRCELGAVELETQAEQWQILYAKAGIRRTVTQAGLRVTFSPEPAVEEELRALVATERQCCGWANWSIDATADELIVDIGSTEDNIGVIHTWLLNEERASPRAPLRRTTTANDS